MHYTVLISSARPTWWDFCLRIVVRRFWLTRLRLWTLVSSSWHAIDSVSPGVRMRINRAGMTDMVGVPPVNCCHLPQEYEHLWAFLNMPLTVCYPSIRTRKLLRNMIQRNTRFSKRSRLLILIASAWPTWRVVHLWIVVTRVRIMSACQLFRWELRVLLPHGSVGVEFALPNWDSRF